MSGFFQTPPRLPDAWAGDPILRDALRVHLGPLYEAAEPTLAAMGRVATDEATLALMMRAEMEPPRLVQFAPWGERVDEIEVSPAYTELGRIGVERGVASLPYEDGGYGDHARVVWAALIALWGPSSALYSCPIAMTDAAARTLLLYGGPDELQVVERLTTRDPERAWTSGQWMTETTGGSDVGKTATVARLGDDGVWRLHGTKWFTSATTSEVALTLARPDGAPEGSRGLGLFLVHRRVDGAPNAITVRRLKDKLGTRALPTAELELEGAVATPIGDPFDGGGLRRISTMLNITRLHNAIGAAGALGRGLAWARSYADVREAFGRRLRDLPAHRVTLTELAVDYAASLALVLRCAELTGKSERATATDAEVSLLRGLTPIAKLATARWAVAGTAEAMEAVGGVGYCEDSGLPALVRNTHVLPIWEGTTNVLALDVLRAAARTGSFDALLEDASRMTSPLVTDPLVGAPAAAVVEAIGTLRSRASVADRDSAEAGARSLAMGAAQTYATALLCRQATAPEAQRGPATARMAARLAERGLVPPPPPRVGDLEDAPGPTGAGAPPP